MLPSPRRPGRAPPSGRARAPCARPGRGDGGRDPAPGGGGGTLPSAQCRPSLHRTKVGRRDGSLGGQPSTAACASRRGVRGRRGPSRHMGPDQTSRASATPTTSLRVGARELLQVAHAAIEDRLDHGVGLAGLLRLVGERPAPSRSGAPGSRASSRRPRTRACGGWRPSGTARCRVRSTCTCAMSMSKRVMTRPPAALSFSASMTMQSIGQARSQARQPVQISRSTSRMPR